MKKKYTQTGFTLLELTITIAILGLLSTLMLANFRQGEKIKRVAISVDGAVNLARLGQNYTLAGKQVQNNGGCASNAVADFRYYITTTSTTIDLYADSQSCGSPILMDSYTLPARVQHKTSGIAYTVCNPGCNTSNVNTLHIKFLPPFGKMMASTNGTTYTNFSTADITFQSDDGTKQKGFRIDGVSGRIGN